MNRRLIVVFAVLILLLLGAFAVAFFLDPDARLHGWVKGEPSYQGRSATAWERDLRQPDEIGPAAARDALAAGKGDAVPVCEYLLRTSPESSVRWRAAEALGRMGPDAAPAGPALVEALSDPDPLVRGVAIRAVGSLGSTVPDAVPALVKLFPDVDAIRAVSNFGPHAAEAVEPLRELLNHPDSVVRWQSARTLGKIREPALPALPDLVKLMTTDPDALVREHAAEALGDIGPAAAAAVPDLVKALGDPAPKVRRDAVRSLGQIGPAARLVLPAVSARLKDPDMNVRTAAERAARLIDPASIQRN